MFSCRLCLELQGRFRARNKLACRNFMGAIYLSASNFGSHTEGGCYDRKLHCLLTPKYFQISETLFFVQISNRKKDGRRHFKSTSKFTDRRIKLLTPRKDIQKRIG